MQALVKPSTLRSSRCCAQAIAKLATVLTSCILSHAAQAQALTTIDRGDAINTVQLTASLDEGLQATYPFSASCHFAGGRASLAEAVITKREFHYLLQGESGGPSITANNTRQGLINSATKIEVTEILYDPAGRDQAPVVILTNPQEVIEPITVADWGLFSTTASLHYAHVYNDTDVPANNSRDNSRLKNRLSDSILAMPKPGRWAW